MAENVKSVGTITWANFKSRHGIAKANIKSWGTIDTTSGSGWEPTDVAGCLAWYKADSLVLSNDDPVSTWADSSGEGNDLVQASGTLQPLYKTNIINSLPVVRFDGSDNYMKTASFTYGQPTTVFLVCKMLSAPAGNEAILDGDSANTFLLYVDAANELQIFTLGGAEDTNVDLGTSDFHIITVDCQTGGNNDNIWIDGAQVITNGTFGTNTISAITLGAVADGTSPSHVDIAELFVYDSVLGSSDRTDAWDYLTAKYAL